MPVPKISVIIATYNRPKILRLALQSLLNQDFKDWEGLVIGDACSEDTAQAVASLGDSRLRYENLPENCGEQSGPNNRGLALAQAPLIAYLNHDDLWWPDHLSSLLAFLEKNNADLAFSLLESVDSNSVRSLHGSSVSGGYEHHLFAPASSWLLRKELAQKLGGWRMSQEIYDIPSHDFLRRAWESGAKLLLHPKLTVLAIQSGIRPNSYANDDSSEYEFWAVRIAEEGSRERELTAIAVRIWAHWTSYTWILVLDPLKLAFRNLVANALARLGVPRQAFYQMLHYGLRRGDFIRYLRKLRGLPPKKD